MKFLDPMFYSFRFKSDGFIKNERLCDLLNLENYKKDMIEYGVCNDFFSQYLRVGGREEFIIQNNFKENSREENFKKIKNYYKNDPREFIRKIRNYVSSKVCPICGSFSTNQVDHHIDKIRCPEFYSFPYNLVPACQCNQYKVKRKLLATKGEKILHPYIDTVLKKPIVKVDVKIIDNYLRFSIVPTIEYSSLKAVRSHISNIFDNKYGEKLEVYAFDTLKEYLLINDEMNFSKSKIESILENLDNEYETPNNWKSMTYRGLLESEDFSLINISHFQ